MDKLTSIVYSEIKRQYKSVRRFSLSIGIPQTTLASSLKNGIGGTSYDTVVRICEALNVKLVNYDNPIKIDDNILELIEKYNTLDDYGIHTVNTVLDMEYSRSRTENRAPAVAAYGGKTFRTDDDNASSKADVQNVLREINNSH